MNSMKKDLKILLIQPPLTHYGEDSNAGAVSFPINLLSVLSYVKKHGYENIMIEDFMFTKEKIRKRLANDSVRIGVDDTEIEKKIRESKPDIVGVSCVFTRYFMDSHSIASITKKINPEVKVIFGGTHATNFWQETLTDKNVDLVVIGEGELTFLDLLNKYSENQSIQDVPGIAYRNNKGKPIKTGVREPLDIKTLPILDYASLDMKRYITFNEDYQMKTPSFQLSTSRGCPMDCIYCSVKTVWGHKWRGKTPDQVLDEIEYLQKNFGIKEISFLDDSISVDPHRFKAICQGIIDRGLKIYWSTPNGIAHWTLNKEILLLMRRAGCYRITFGIESGNNEIRKFIGKPFDLAQAKELLQYANKIGMWTVITTIFGFPYETKEKIMDTVNFALSCGVDYAAFYKLTPYPDAPLYKIMREEKLLNFDAMIDPNSQNARLISNFLSAEVRTRHLSNKELDDLVGFATKKFLKNKILRYVFRPWEVFYKVYSKDSLLYTLKIVISVIKLVFRSIYYGRFDVTMLRKKQKEKKYNNE
jgi:anaerobic magnesium-protoporphyrin IX monomethyl ester cyclase